MAVKLEVVGKSADTVSVAFYYPVPAPDQEASANDQSRVAAGASLSAGELQDLKDGILFEFTRGFSTFGFTVAQMKTRLEAAWTELQVEALAVYKARYENLGAAWGGTTWS